jgi:hypothetical protein
MMKSKCVVFAAAMVAAAWGVCAAQQATAPPKVLVIQQEFLKPGKAGSIHDRSESGFVQAMTRAKWPTHYVALNSMSGRSRAEFLMGYDSFADWQKDNDAVQKNAALAAELDRLDSADGELQTEYDQYVLVYQPDMSLRVNADLSHARYMEASIFHLHPGHHKDWTDAVKMVIDAHQKAGTSANWAMYELEYGGGDEYVLFSADKDMAAIDQGFAEDKKFIEAIGPDGLKKLDELAAACIESSRSELFEINPRQSYAPEKWVKANPEFWKPKAMGASAAKAGEKPQDVKPHQQ